VVVRVLIVEDDQRLADRTAEYLRGHGAVVEAVHDGDTGLSRASSGQHDVVLLDLMLPGIDGLELCRQLRTASGVPVIMLSARGEEVDRIVGLEMGADDYLPKPFSPRELLARMRAVLRRSGGESNAAPQVEVGPVVIDRDRRVVTCDGTDVRLTAHQFDLLFVLARESPRVLSRAELHEQTHRLRGEEPGDFAPGIDRSIDVQLSKVRQALSGASERATGLIKGVRGVGYALDGGDE
jgi:DNA-binding response OmpR family regulator